VSLTTENATSWELPIHTAVAPVKPLPVIVTPDPMEAALGERALISGADWACSTMNEVLENAAPPGASTASCCAPSAASRGTVALIWRSLTTENTASWELPIHTAVAPVKPPPVMVRSDAMAPEPGEKALIWSADGAWTARSPPDEPAASAADKVAVVPSVPLPAGELPSPADGPQASASVEASADVESAHARRRRCIRVADDGGNSADRRIDMLETSMGIHARFSLIHANAAATAARDDRSRRRTYGPARDVARSGIASRGDVEARRGISPDTGDLSCGCLRRRRGFAPGRTCPT